MSLPRRKSGENGLKEKDEAERVFTVWLQILLAVRSRQNAGLDISKQQVKYSLKWDTFKMASPSRGGRKHKMFRIDGGLYAIHRSDGDPWHYIGKRKNNPFYVVLI